MQTTVTYRDLDEVLTQFGFRKSVQNGHVFYTEADHRAVVALPNLSPEEPVRAHHYIAARAEVDGMGIAPETDFEQAMRSHGDLPAGIRTVV